MWIRLQTNRSRRRLVVAVVMSFGSRNTYKGNTTVVVPQSSRGSWCFPLLWCTKRLLGTSQFGRMELGGGPPISTHNWSTLRAQEVSLRCCCTCHRTYATWKRMDVSVMFITQRIQHKKRAQPIANDIKSKIPTHVTFHVIEFGYWHFFEIQTGCMAKKWMHSYYGQTE